MHEVELQLIDAAEPLPHTPPVVNPKKNSPQPITKAIRLKPSVTDYATFVATTSKVLGTTGPASRKTKPNKLVLSVANLGS
jgi:hypothetical protein